MSASTIGASERRTEDKRFITGRGQYTDDIRRPYQTHACFLRSPHAHATIKGIDTKKASKMPGVLAIYTGADLANDKVIPEIADLRDESGCCRRTARL